MPQGSFYLSFHADAILIQLSHESITAVYRFPTILRKIIYIYIHWVVTLPTFLCCEWKETGNIRMHLNIELQNVFSKRDIIRVKD